MDFLLEPPYMPTSAVSHEFPQVPPSPTSSSSTDDQSDHNLSAGDSDIPVILDQTAFKDHDNNNNNNEDDDVEDDDDAKRRTTEEISGKVAVVEEIGSFREKVDIRPLGISIYKRVHPLGFKT